MTERKVEAMAVFGNDDGARIPFVSRGGGGNEAGGGKSPLADAMPPAAEWSRGVRDMALSGVSRRQRAAERENDGEGPQLGVGDVVGGYAITAISGRPGSFGRVWIAHKADDPAFKVAIKEMLRKDEDRREELRSTFRLVCDIKNDHIADPVRIAEKDGRLFTIMRFAEGVSLDRWVSARGGSVPLPLACEIGGQIADALDAAHRKNVMHLDIKPENVMVEDLPDGGVHVQVLDFGLARRINVESGDKALQGLGTTEYIAPEMWLGLKRPDGRADEYSLACVLYWLLSGATPFFKTFAAALRQLGREHPDATPDETKSLWRATEEEIGRKVVAILPVRPLACLDKGRNKALLRALDKDPDRRYRTCAAMVNAVRRGPSKAWRPFAAIAALMALGGGALFVWGRLEAERQQAIREVWERIGELGGRSRLDTLRAKAEGDADAAFELAQRLATGTNVKKDDGEAFRWFSRAGELGKAEAMFRAGDCLMRGIGTKRDEAAAANWFRRAAEMGNPDGAGAFAACLWDGRGVARDRPAAEEWARKGLDAAVPSARWVAGLALVEGIGPEHNPQRGATLVQSAAQTGDARAEFALSELLSRGDGLAQNENEAAKWSLRAAEQGLREAALDMGERYAAGRGVLPNAAESRRWLALAKKMGTEGD